MPDREEKFFEELKLGDVFQIPVGPSAGTGPWTKISMLCKISETSCVPYPNGGESIPVPPREVVWRIPSLSEENAGKITFIRLHDRWRYNPDDRLGPAGGFGQVFAGKGGPKDEDVAIKRLHDDVSHLAHRELDIAEELRDRELEHVVPVLDSGQDADSGRYFLVMPKAEKSLQDEIHNRGPFSEETARAILVDVVDGLLEIPDLVHRDLKPGNILFHDGRWKIADFGLSRIMEKATSARTLKDYMTFEYAAPEQWRSERVTHFTDVYALGCIAYALLTGEPPFTGTTEEDLQEQHLDSLPAPVDGISERLQSLLSLMLNKAPRARPPYERIKRIFLSSLETEQESQGLEALERAGAEQAREDAEEGLRQTQREQEEKRRRELFESGSQSLDGLILSLLKEIDLRAPAATRSAQHVVQLGGAELRYTAPVIVNVAFPESKWDVVARASIQIENCAKSFRYGANLFYARRPSDEEYRWWEASFDGHPYSDEFRKYTNIALEA